MAHRVAQLLERAENAESAEDREASCRECTDLVLRLWAMRLDWPDGGPFVHIMPALQRIAEAFDAPKYSWHVQHPKDSWSETLFSLDNIARRESRICVCALAAEFSIEAAHEARQWLEQHGEDFPEEERQILENFIEWVEHVYADDFHLDKTPLPNFGALPPKERTVNIRKTLAILATERKKLIANTVSSEQPLETLAPNAIHGFIKEDEEREAEHFAEIYATEEDDLDENVEDEPGDSADESGDRYRIEGL